MTSFRTSLNKFYAGRLYPVAVATIVFLAHAFALEAVGIPLVLALVLVGCFVCCDARFFIPSSLCLFCVVSVAHSPAFSPFSKFFTEGAMPVLLAVYAALLLAGIVVFILRNRKRAGRFSLQGQVPGLIAFAAGLLLNGIFSGSYSGKNLLLALALCLSIPFLYFFLVFFLPRTREVQNYFFFTMLCTGLLVVAELIVLYFTRVEFDGLTPLKDSITIGWGRWTNIGAYLVMLMPAAFYFAHSSKKRGHLFFILGLLLLAGIFFSGSRGALLYGCIIFLLCMLLLFLGGPNRQKNRRFILLLVAASLAVGAIFFEKLIAFLEVYIKMGFSDTGRFALWRQALACFPQAPLFGKGFFGTGIHLSYELSFPLYPHTCHDTFLHLLASCGLVGLGTYLYHRVLTVRLLWRKRKDPAALFLFLSIAALLLCSLTDEHLFHFYPGFCYTYALYLAEIPEEAGAAT